jgi:beta-glucosidase
LEFSIAWFADPIYLGNYPASMRKQLGERLPTFTDAERALVQGSNDFYGQNHYCANYIRHTPGTLPPEDFCGGLEILFEDVYGNKIGPDTQSAWLKPNPQGFRKLMNWISKRYGKPKILVTENGTSILGETQKSKEDILNDDFRVKYFEDYVQAMAEAYAEDGVNVRAYMAWSLME